MTTIQSYPHILTADYPIRFKAWENPKTWVLYSGDNIEQPTEKAVFADVMRNTEWPTMEDGIFINIGAHNGLSCAFYLDCYFEEPNKCRKQHSFSGKYSDIDTAIKAAEKWLAEVYQKLEAK